jgi:hypothetical protein
MADMKPATTAMRPPDDPMVPLRPNNVDAVDAVNEWVEAPDAVQVEEEAGQLDDDSHTYFPFPRPPSAPEFYYWNAMSYL